MRDPDKLFPEDKATPVIVEAQTLRSAEQAIASCESCTPDVAEIPFDCLLDSITGCDPEATDYVLSETAHCPACGAELRTGYWRWSESTAEGRRLYPARDSDRYEERLTFRTRNRRFTATTTLLLQFMREAISPESDRSNRANLRFFEVVVQKVRIPA